jgi:hypothetical protein
LVSKVCSPYPLTRHALTAPASPSHRQNCNRNLVLNDAQCARLREDKSLRLLLFGAVDQPLAPYTRLDITFPSQIEVRVNNEEVKANYKGLKNKPGSTRPADITAQVKISPANFRNNIVVTYALTQKASQPKEVSYPHSVYARDHVLTGISEVHPLHLHDEEVVRGGIDTEDQATRHN